MVRHSRARLLGILLLAGSAALAASAFDESRDTWIRGSFTGLSPRVVVTDTPTAWQLAQECAARTSDSIILVGGGHSMRPLYPSGTILVLRVSGYDELRPGQTVVYRNTAGRAVAHLLIAKARDGWRVKGLNNRMHDMEPVVADNLIGVVTGAYLPDEKPDRVFASVAPRHRTLFLDDRPR